MPEKRMQDDCCSVQISLVPTDVFQHMLTLTFVSLHIYFSAKFLYCIPSGYVNINRSDGIESHEATKQGLGKVFFFFNDFNDSPNGW